MPLARRLRLAKAGLTVSRGMTVAPKRAPLRPHRILAGFVLVAVVTGALVRPLDAAEPAPAGTDMPAAQRALYDAGLGAYARKDYPVAIAAFEQALAIEDRPEIVFALAQAVRLSGDCPRAGAGGDTPPPRPSAARRRDSRSGQTDSP